MLIKKNEEPFFHRFLSIAKEIIKKNGEYLPILFGDDEKLYLACDNYAAVYDFQSNLLLDDELREFGKVPYELSELPNGDLMLTKADHFNCQDSYLIAVKQFFEAVGYLSRKVFSVEKGDPYKIPKIVEVTNRWISEDDNKILDRIGSPDIYLLDEERDSEFTTMAGDWNQYYLGAYDQIELNGGQTTIAMTVYFNIKDDPKHNAYDQQEMEFVQQPAEYDAFENMDVDEPEETYQEEQELDSLMNETIIEETRGVEDEFDPMRA